MSNCKIVSKPPPSVMPSLCVPPSERVGSGDKIRFLSFQVLFLFEDGDEYIYIQVEIKLHYYTHAEI